MRRLAILATFLSLSYCITSSYASDIPSQQAQEAMKSSHNLVLFYKPSCPYCKKVLTAINTADKGIQLKNIQSDKQATHELLRIGGKRQVPCLIIDGKPLYESQAIIEWLSQN